MISHSNLNALKIGVAIFTLAASLSGISYFFWKNEVRYRLPTPVPQNYSPVALGEPVNLGGKLNASKGQPLFLHFFNPECPCSRFNLAHFKTLVKEYGDRLQFSVMVVQNEKVYTEAELQTRYDLDLPIYFDESIANACGVYSTPQAVLIDGHSRLYYRGNYNKSRYCTEKTSNYAQMAIDSFLAREAEPQFNQFALQAYGCELPNCTR